MTCPSDKSSLLIVNANNSIQMEKSLMALNLVAVLFLLILPLMMNADFINRRSKRSLLRRFRPMPESATGQQNTTKSTKKYKWTEEWYEGMPVDHFAYGNTGKFKLRYLINTEKFMQKDAPIFFFTGCESSIDEVPDGNGFLYDLAPEFGAAIVFAEHRYYGKSLPFGNESFSSLTNLGLLSSEQALGDFALLIDHLKAHRLPNATRSPVIAFGGSYCGDLTAYMRIKYPHVVDGGIASSAPLFYHRNSPRPGVEQSYDDITTRTFAAQGLTEKILLKTFDALRQLCKTSEGRKFVNEKLNLDPTANAEMRVPEDADWLVSWFPYVMGYTAMANYPYATNWITPLPAWPVKEVSKPFITAKTQKDLVLASANMFNIFFNYTGTLKTLCLNGDNCTSASDSIDDTSAIGDPWGWQVCTELVHPICRQGAPYYQGDFTCPFNYTNDVDACISEFGDIGYNESLYRPDWAIQNYGAEFTTATNLIFSNGYMDPWSGGGWRLNNTKEGSLVSLIIKDGAHHYDLRGQHPNDTAEIKEVRKQEKSHIKKWIKQAREFHQLAAVKNLT